MKWVYGNSHKRKNTLIQMFIIHIYIMISYENMGSYEFEQTRDIKIS